MAQDASDPCLLWGRAKAALGLERQIQDADRVIRGFESTLVQEAPISDGRGALQDRVSELQVGFGRLLPGGMAARPGQAFGGRSWVDTVSL